MSDLLKLCDQIEVQWITTVEAIGDKNIKPPASLMNLIKAARVMHEAHKANSDEDYRGNRSSASQRSFRALAEADRIAKGEK